LEVVAAAANVFVTKEEVQMIIAGIALDLIQDQDVSNLE
jgi:hypothetical protein